MKKLWDKMRTDITLKFKDADTNRINYYILIFTFNALIVFPLMILMGLLIKFIIFGDVN